MIISKWCQFPQDIDLFRYFQFKASAEVDWRFENFLKLSIDDLCFTLVLDTDIVSFILGRKCSYLENQVFEIHLIETDFRLRNRGYMSLLWLNFTDQLIALNYKSIFLEVHENNVQAINFYIKRGFLLSRKRNNYYKDGGAALELKLDI